MSKKIKIGIFGANRGLCFLNILARHPETEVVAICDKVEEWNRRVQKAALDTDSQITFYTDFDKFFEHDMDAVVLANYANEHAPYAVKFLKSGRHVASEVLPVETLAQAVQLVEAVEESGKVYTYAENYCYFAAVQEMRRLYRRGDLGEFIHGEGEYVHDASKIAHIITYGQKDHWRRYTPPTFYCTHSLGPIVSITGTRPVKVVGFENARGAVEMIQMDNGATVRSLHGGMKREPWMPWYVIYGTKGMAESDRWMDGVGRVNVYVEGQEVSENAIKYTPIRPLNEMLENNLQFAAHWGGDFYTMHYFVQKILGAEEGNEALDVYQALDMGLPGLFAHRSILSGNQPFEIPDFRDKKAREKFRNDNRCTNPKVAGDGELLERSVLKKSPRNDMDLKDLEKKWNDFKQNI